MEKFEANAIKIADYLENKMSIQEEEAFMHELENDPGLRSQYEEELLMHALLNDAENAGSENKNMIFQPADEHINMIEAALKKEERSQSHITRLFKQYGAVAAILLLAIAVAAILMHVKSNNNSNSNNIVVNPVHKDSFKSYDTNSKLSEEQVAKTNEHETKHNKVDSIKKEEPLIATNNANTDSLFKAFYTPYSKDDDEPAELKSYYTSLEKKDYKNVINATDADYQLMGSGDRNALLKQYMDLYKGLSYMAMNNTTNAIANFEEVLKTADKTDRVYYNAEWYLALSYIKEKNIQKALPVLQTISQSVSPFKKQAEPLQQQLIK